MSKPTWARIQALKTIRRINSRQAFARPLIDAHIRPAQAPAAERDFAILLVLGVAATVGELDHIIRRSLGQRRVDATAMDILRLATYELVFLHKPAYAAIDQAAALTQRQRPQAVGFVNWVLHHILEDTTDFPWGNPDIDLEALAHSQAFPFWLAEQLVDEYGFSAARAFMQAANQTAPLFAQELTWGSCLTVDATDMADLTKRIAAGEAIVADASTQRVAALVADQAAGYPTCRLLEIGSGRGTKTVLVNRQLQRSGLGSYSHWAVDNQDFKTKALADRISQYRLKGVTALTADALSLTGLSEQEGWPDGFDVVFIDAPCSGSGTLRRNPEIRWRLTADEVRRLAAQSQAFLQAAAPLVEMGGSLIYATCSMLAEENEAVIEAFLASPVGAGFMLLPLDDEAGAGIGAGRGCIPNDTWTAGLPSGSGKPADAPNNAYLHTWQPDNGGDGHFAALLKKTVV